MNLHHMAIVTADMSKAIKFWRDFMGFSVLMETTVPDPDGAIASQQLMDDIFRVHGAKTKITMLKTDGGALIELLQPENPKVQSLPREHQRYSYIGIRELGLTTEDIDAFFAKVRNAGYETAADYIWGSRETGRTFIFYDDEGNQIQMFQNP